jgi:hypothetical protein
MLFIRNDHSPKEKEKEKKRKINNEKKDEQRKKEKESVHQHWTSARKRLERRGERGVIRGRNEYARKEKEGNLRHPC